MLMKKINFNDKGGKRILIEVLSSFADFHINSFGFYINNNLNLNTAKRASLVL